PNDTQRFSITESVFRFGADVRSGDSPLEAQMRMIRDGEAMPLEQDSEPSDDDEQEDEQLESSEDDDAEEENK
ncbi:TPA: chromosome partition protein MukE, partial [Proteus mirabilis]